LRTWTFTLAIRFCREWINVVDPIEGLAPLGMDVRDVSWGTREGKVEGYRPLGET